MTQNLTIQRLLTDKSALNKSRIDHVSIAPVLSEGEVILKIERAAITTNNITYAAFGDAMQYWDFFPTGAPDWGHMPVWGFARVAQSKAAGVETGELFYGYFPIASHIRMQAERVSERGFYDGSDHRRTLVSAYNQYTRCSDDPAYRAGNENYQMLVRPLFITSFVLDLVLAQAQLHGARTIVISSASSKTAYGLAFLLTQRALEQRGYAVLGLTSARNLAFVGTLGVYDRVLDYDALAMLDERAPTVYVDFIASQAVRAGLRARLGGALVREYLVGFLSRETSDVVPFFAPDVIRAQATALGRAVFAERFAAAWRAFVQFVAHHPAEPLRVRAERGGAALERVYDALLAGTLSPRDGVSAILRLMGCGPISGAAVSRRIKAEDTWPNRRPPSRHRARGSPRRSGRWRAAPTD